MKNKTPLFIALSILTLISYFVLSPKSVLAQTPLSLQVSPPILEIEIDPGETYSDFIKFENLSGTETLVLYPQILSFKAKGEEGAQEFIENNTETTNFSLSQWVDISTDVITIGPLKRIVLPFTITVPADAEPGGRYAAVLLGNQPSAPGAGSNVALGTRTGSIILAKVTGEVTENASLTLFKTGKETYQYPPVDFEITIQNSGNIHVKPLGKIEISNIFGKKVDEVVVNESNGNVLPESSRKFTPSWETDKFTIGKFTAVLNLEYGDQESKSLTSTVSFWVLPIKEIAIAGGVLVLFILLFFVLVKTYNKMVIKKALKMKEEAEKTNPTTNTQNSTTPTPQNMPSNPPSQMS